MPSPSADFAALQEEILELLAMDDETIDCLAEMLDVPVERADLEHALTTLQSQGRVRSYRAGYADARKYEAAATWWSVRPEGHRAGRLGEVVVAAEKRQGGR